MDQSFLGSDEELVEDQRVGLFAQAPEDHQHDDRKAIQRRRFLGDASAERTTDEEGAQPPPAAFSLGARSGLA